MLITNNVPVDYERVGFITKPDQSGERERMEERISFR